MTEKSLKFHIKSDDYFGTLATVISIIRQQPDSFEDNIKVLTRIEKDLVFLQSNYKIVKK